MSAARRARRPVDLARVRASLGRLEAVIREHPEIRERTAAFLASDPSPSTMEILVSEPASTAQPVKLPPELLARADALTERLAAHPSLIGYTRATRATVVRLALARGLDALAEELRILEAAPGGSRA